MATKQNFEPEEWTKILQSPMLAGMAVSAAEPSGLWGALKEAIASGSALATAKSEANSNELIKDVVADFETSTDPLGDPTEFEHMGTRSTANTGPFWLRPGEGVTLRFAPRP